MYDIKEAFKDLDKIWEDKKPTPAYKMLDGDKVDYEYAYTHMDRFLTADKPEDFDKFYEIKDAAELAKFLKANIDETEFYNRAGNKASIEEFAKYIINNHLNESLNEELSEDDEDKLFALFNDYLTGWSYDSFMSAGARDKEEIAEEAIKEFPNIPKEEIYDLFWDWASGLTEDDFEEFEEEDEDDDYDFDESLKESNKGPFCK